MGEVASGKANDARCFDCGKHLLKFGKFMLDIIIFMLYYYIKLVRFTGVPLIMLVECGDLH